MSERSGERPGERPVFDPVTGEIDMEELTRRLLPDPPPPMPKAVVVKGKVVRDAEVTVSRVDPNARPEDLVSIDPRYRYEQQVVKVIAEDPDWFEPASDNVVSGYDPFERAHREGPSLHRLPGDSDW
jgi:hypothetical protein